jgi:UDP-sulfoquinovose synthase
MQCIRLALETPAKAGEMRILNQFVEVFSVNQLADKVSTAARSMGLSGEIENIPNPRIEAEEHYYKPARTGFSKLGLVSHHLTDDVIAGMLELVLRFRPRIKTEQFVRGVSWRGA